jgi:cob(I)alamin adenosyltransferase
MKIYTRTGDKGETGLLGGSRVPKDHIRLEAYGTVDELNSHVGMLRDLAGGHQAILLAGIQSTLFSLGSRLASTDEAEADRFQVPGIGQAEVDALEQAMDAMDAELPPLRNFLLPGGHPAVSQAHICRTVCRRAERQAVALAGTAEVPDAIIRYLNRLSDLFFVLARWLSLRLGVPEVPWTPRG